MEDCRLEPLAAAVPRMLRCRGWEGRRALQLHRPGRHELVWPAGTQDPATSEAEAVVTRPMAPHRAQGDGHPSCLPGCPSQHACPAGLPGGGTTQGRAHG